MQMPRLYKGQVSFDKLISFDTCHDVRKLRGCEYCHKMGLSTNMVQPSKGVFYHGRCFERKFDVERLLELPRDQVSRLTLGDLGVTLARAVVDGLRSKGAE
jgi:hypothetical protein